MRSTWVLIAVIGIIAASCASPADEPSASTIPSDPEAVVVTVEQSGGCFMMGPNCPTYVLHANGRVDLFRTEAEGTRVDSAVIDVALLEALAEQIRSTDFVALRARLPEGECQGCFDGIDTKLVLTTSDREVTFSSIDEELSATEPLFDAVWSIVHAASQSTEMRLEQRP
jgi:hypothetical protein